ncbi:F-box/LRR-repeat protein 2-like isoform X1 [Euwallacea fornicatus]|uniref:F-box/LRR-repeat protein 2-like isoform X1 n=1 Tax=Euwallacea fornicatus TaxID=995702 RepID=UPI00338F4F0F
MPKFKDVPTLKTLALKSIGLFIVHTTPAIMNNVQYIRDSQKLITNVQKSIDRLNETLVSYVPYYLYESMAVEVLQAVRALIEKTKKHYYPRVSMSKYWTEMNIVVSLTEVVLNSRLRSVDFSQWPKIMRYVLYKNLEKMSGLENLNLGSCTGDCKTMELDKSILCGIRNMKNLRSICLCFDCSDVIIQTISENCAHIQCIDVMSSRSVTDRSIPYLLNCKNLKELQLHRTSITTAGHSKLICGLPKLRDIGRCDEFSDIIEHISQREIHYGPFELRKVHTRDLTTESAILLVSMFPKLEFISLFYYDLRIADLSAFISLNHLREVKFLSCAFYEHSLNELLKVGGFKLTHLHLEHVEEMDMNVLVVIGKYCPKIKSLVFYNCDFRYFANERPIGPTMCSQPFRNLERVFWVVDGSISHLEVILTYAVNIKYIHLGSSTGITHSNLVNILRVNPMKYLEELRVLYSCDMSMRTVELLLASCPNLKVLSELESWQGISMDELKAFKKHIKEVNFDLDISPTLSFTSC